MNLHRRSGVRTLRPARARRDRSAATTAGSPHHGPARVRRPRIALYSHDAQGLGHVRRNLAIARALRALDAEVLLLTGAPEATGTRHIPGIDIVSVPALAKTDEGRYGPRTLGLGTAEVLRIRAEVLCAAVGSFRPDLLIVDKHPRGFRGEMHQALTTARRMGAKVVLGLRDVLDTPQVARAEWRRDRANAILRSHYDEVWLYGDPDVYDGTAGLNLPVPVRATGYLATGRVPRAHQLRRPRTLDDRPYVLGVLGGGSDGAPVARAFAQATYPTGHQGVLITGPNLPDEERRALRRLAEGRDDLTVHTFRDDLDHYYGGARAVVAMGGYNTVCEVLGAGRSLLVVPRVRPRAEQLVRAAALRRRGALDMCHPDHLDPAALTDWFNTLNGPPTPATPIALDGLDRIPGLAARLLGRTEVAHSA